MQVYVPGRVGKPSLNPSYLTTLDGRKVAFGMYFAGDYREVSGYLRQFTRGKRINDVYHKKPVSYGRQDAISDIAVIRVNGQDWDLLGSYSGLVGNSSNPQGRYWSSSPLGLVHLATSGGYQRAPFGKYRLVSYGATITINVPKGGNKFKHGFGSFSIGLNSSQWSSGFKVNGDSGYFIQPGTSIATKLSEPIVFDSLVELQNWALDSATDWFSIWSDILLEYTSYNGNLVTSSGNFTITGIKPLSGLRKEDSLFKEEIIFGEKVDPILLGNGIENNSYWRNWLVQHAYLDALESAPVMNDNNIQNLAEVFKFMKTLVVDKKVEIPTSLQDAWLSYRYSYTTTKLDYKEAVDFVHRQIDLGGVVDSLKCFGASRTTVLGIPVTCRCSLSLTRKELAGLVDAWDKLYQYGLQPNFYVVWDAIPYSFIVDWLLPIGDIAHVLDAEQHYMTGNYKIEDVCFSLSYDTYNADDYLTYHHYTRWESQPLESLNELYWFDKPAASDKVQCFRIMDAASLITSK